MAPRTRATPTNQAEELTPSIRRAPSETARASLHREDDPGERLEDDASQQGEVRSYASSEAGGPEEDGPPTPNVRQKDDERMRENGEYETPPHRSDGPQGQTSTAAAHGPAQARGLDEATSQVLMQQIMTMMANQHELIAAALSNRVPAERSPKVYEKPPNYNVARLTSESTSVEREDWLVAVEEAHKHRPGCSDSQYIQWALSAVEHTLQMEWRTHQRTLVDASGKQVDPIWEDFRVFVRRQHIAPELQEWNHRDALRRCRQKEDEKPIAYWARWESINRALGEPNTGNAKAHAFFWGFTRTLKDELFKQDVDRTDAHTMALHAQRLWEILEGRRAGRPAGRSESRKRPHSGSLDRPHKSGSRPPRSTDLRERRPETPSRNDRSANPRAGPGSNSGPPDLRGTQCYNCKKYGHISPNCTEPRTQPTGSNRNPNPRRGGINAIAVSRANDAEDSGNE